ncbi:MAG: hypothetical protein OES09_14120 [Gammaproteobacteria bacterium]|nr:hypothetical protein [Gammaproteobacteria bacterium]
MNPLNIWLLGDLASHSRGKIIREAVYAEAIETLPDAFGLVLAFGNEFQDADESLRQNWVAWCEAAGRTLLLIPPYRIVETALPIVWRVYRPDGLSILKSPALVRTLVGEIKHEFDTGMQVPDELGGLSTTGGINTGFYRKHPHSGLFAITGLPLWSLSVLDHKNHLIEWLTALHALAGESIPADAAFQEVDEFVANRNHFALILHLQSGAFSSREEALYQLADSPVLALPGDMAEICMTEIEQAGWASHGDLTETGRQALMNSPYAVYAEAMEANRE